MLRRRHVLRRLSDRRARDRGPAGRRGLALVTVLWVLMLLALVAASFTRTTRTEINLTRNPIGNTKAGPHLKHGYTRTEIARYLGLHYTTLSKIVTAAR